MSVTTFVLIAMIVSGISRLVNIGIFYWLTNGSMDFHTHNITRFFILSLLPGLDICITLGYIFIPTIMYCFWIGKYAMKGVHKKWNLKFLQ